MSKGTARAHLGGDPDRLHDFGLGRSVTMGGLNVPANAVRTLRHVRDSDGDQLLLLGVQGAGRENALAEATPRFFDLGGGVAAPLANGGSCFGQRIASHGEAGNTMGSAGRVEPDCPLA